MSMSLRKNIAFYIEDFETPIGLAIDFAILGLILLSVVMFVAETFPISTSLLDVFHVVDTVILIVFTLEYLIRLWAAENKIRYIFSLFSFIDLIAIVPLFFGWLDVRYVRIFRWFRLLRIIRFLDFEIFIFRIQTEDGIILTRILLTLFSIIFIYSGLIYQVEHQVNPELIKNFFDSLYFCIVTMTTVGFGDITPLSDQGRALTLIMILTGVTFIPWQIKDLIQQLLKTANKVEKKCSDCGLAWHEPDAKYCKNCGVQLEEISMTTSIKQI